MAMGEEEEEKEGLQTLPTRQRRQRGSSWRRAQSSCSQSRTALPQARTSLMSQSTRGLRKHRQDYILLQQTLTSAITGKRNFEMSLLSKIMKNLPQSHMKSIKILVFLFSLTVKIIYISFNFQGPMETEDKKRSFLPSGTTARSKPCSSCFLSGMWLCVFV